VGLTDAQRAGGIADTELVARWLDDGITPNGAQGRALGPGLMSTFADWVHRAAESMALNSFPPIDSFSFEAKKDCVRSPNVAYCQMHVDEFAH
jgi:hypothetical protein